MARKTTVRDRMKMIEMWRSGDFTKDEIARKFGVSQGYATTLFAKHAARRGDAEKQIGEALTKSMQAKLQNEIDATARVALQQKEFHMKSVDWLSKKTMMIVRQAQEEKLNLVNFHDELKTIQLVSRTLALNYNTAARILNIDKQEEKLDEDSLPSFEIRVMTDAMIEKMRDEQEIEDAAIYGNGMIEVDENGNPIDYTIESEDVEADDEEIDIEVTENAENDLMLMQKLKDAMNE